MFIWEEVKTNHGSMLYRAKVVGGWLVKEEQEIAHYTEYTGFVSGYDWTSSITFVPDINHQWEIEDV